MSGYADPDIKQTSKFVKIEAGVPVDLRILNPSPAESFEHFDKSEKTSFQCKGADACPACLDGEEPTQKFITNVYDFGAKKVRIWKYGGQVARQIKEIAITLAEEGKTVLEVDLRISAEGSNLQKKYTVTPRMTAKPIPEGLKLFEINEIPF